MVKKFNGSKKFRKILPEKREAALNTFKKIDDEFIESFLKKVAQLLRQELFVEYGNKILVCVSGGVDSVVLLDSLSLLSRVNNYNLAVAHLNHMIRGSEADADEEFVISLSKSYGWVCYVQKSNIPVLAKKQRENLENLARQIRYDFYLRACQSFGGEFIATAHTLDDQAETVLHNLIRGTGIRGLRGIDSRRVIKDFKIIRPFIIFTKEEIIEYANRRGLKWREDVTNLLEKYTRNKIRLKLIPFLKESFNPKIVNVLARTSEIAKSCQKIVSQYIDSFYNKCVYRINPEEVEIKTNLLRHLEKFVLMELFQEILYRNFKIIFGYDKIEFIINLINAKSGKGFSFSKDIIIYKHRDSLLLVKIKSQEIEPVTTNKVGKVFFGGYLIELIEVPLEEFVRVDDNNVEFFDFDKIPEKVTFRFWMEGDFFLPLGMKSKVKLSDFFINLKVPLHRKKKIPLMVANEEIIWVCGFRISDKFKVTRNSKRVLRANISELTYLGENNES